MGYRVIDCRPSGQAEGRRHRHRRATNLSPPGCWRQSRFSQRRRFRHTPRPPTGPDCSPRIGSWVATGSAVFPGRRRRKHQHRDAEFDGDCGPGRTSPEPVRRSKRDRDAYNPDRRDIGRFLRTIGNLPGGLGTVTVTGAGSSWSNEPVVVGGQGTGTLTIQDGGTVIVAAARSDCLPARRAR